MDDNIKKISSEFSLFYQLPSLRIKKNQKIKRKLLLAITVQQPPKLKPSI